MQLVAAKHDGNLKNTVKAQHWCRNDVFTTLQCHRY